MLNANATVYPAAGTVVWVPVYLVYRHRGIVSDRWEDGKPMVICNAAGFGVLEQTWDQFGKSKQIQVEGYPGQLPHYEVLRRARSHIGSVYHLTEFNCDHLVNEAHGLPCESVQVKATLSIAAVAGLLFAAVAR